MIAKSSREPEAFDADVGANVTDLSKLIKVEPYLTPHSDIVAFLVLEHQAPTHKHLSAEDRQAILSILLDTKQDLSASW